MRRIVGSEPVPGGQMVTVEVAGVFTDGSARQDRVFVPHSAITGRTREEILHAVRDVAANPLDQVVGENIDAPVAATQAVWEQRLRPLREEWWWWRETRTAVELKSPTARALITALQEREDVAWAAYVEGLNKWRTAG